MARMENYRMPGVYPRRVNEAATISVDEEVRIPVIVGRAQHDIPATVRVVRGSGASDTITAPTGVTFSVTGGAVEITRVGDYYDQDKYKPIGYAVVARRGYTFAGTWALPSTTITWTGAALAPTAGEAYWIAYKYKIEDVAYQPYFYTDEADIIAAYGAESALNLATVGAILALRNGAPVVGVIQLDLIGNSPYSITDANLSNLTAAQLAAVMLLAFTAALDEVKKLDFDRIRYLVPMTTADATFDEYLDHVYEYSLGSVRRWRMLVRGMPSQPAATNTYVSDEVITLADNYRATGAEPKRVITTMPGEVARVIIDENGAVATLNLDGSAVAAAVAGRICGFLNPAVPITNKIMAGFTLGRTFNIAEQTKLGSYGICTFVNRRSQVRCMHGLTCDLTDATTQEVSLVEVEDFIKAQSLRQLESKFVGAPLTRSVFASVNAALTSYWEGLIVRGVIAEYDQGSVSAKASPSDPRTIIVNGRILPVFPLNWIDISFSFTSGLAAA